jgi:formylglycine-generating enzyme required for sulfatase activity
MPTEAEWEYACRSGSRTAYSFGRIVNAWSLEALSNYAWWQNSATNAAREVGLLRPNDLGTFDMLGNAHEWCLDEYKGYCEGRCGEVREDRIDDGVIAMKSIRVLRGGWFHDPHGGCESGHRSSGRAESTATQNGLRLARTILRDS